MLRAATSYSVCSQINNRQCSGELVRPALGIHRGSRTSSWGSPMIDKSVLPVGWEFSQGHQPGGLDPLHVASPRAACVSFQYGNWDPRMSVPSTCRNSKPSYDLVPEGPGCHLLSVKQIPEANPDPTESNRLHSQ